MDIFAQKCYTRHCASKTAKMARF